MIIKRKSILTGVCHELDIPVTPKQLALWHRGMHIQDAMPNVSAGHREFLMTGITPDEWAAEFGDEEDCLE